MRHFLKRRPLLLAGLAALIALAVAGAAQAVVTPTTNDAAGASALATAMAANPATVTGGSFDAIPPSGTPHGVSDGLNEFPTSGTTFSILTSGNVNLADDANVSGSSGANDGGGNVRGVSDLDVTILKVNLAVPAGSNCLTFDFKFFSEEYPEYVGSSVSDSFIAELDTSDWTTTGGGNPPTAPHNFAFDQAGNPISINTTGPLGMTAAEATGTTYDGATPLLKASTQVTPGAHVLYLSIFDQGDQIFDSAVFLDNLVIGFVPDPATQCKPGAQPKTFNLTLTPAEASNPTGTAHTVTAHLTDSGTAVAGATVKFTVTGANPTTGTGVTTATGDATFTYTGANGGDDTIVACYDSDGNGTCGDNGDPLASAIKHWVAPAPTTLTTSLSGGGQSGPAITVPSGTAVTDSATLAGTNAATAGGTVTYTVYSNAACTTLAASGGTKTVTNGVVPSSDPVTLTAAGTYYWVAVYSGDSANATSTSGCGAETQTVTAVVTDTTKPSCALTAVGTDSTGKKYAEATVSDGGSGLASVTVTKSVNANTVVPPFTPGTTSPVVVRSTKINQSQTSTFELTVTDVAGNKTVCDPVITVVLRENGEDSQTHDGLPAAESKITVVNDTPGVKHMDFAVNGVKFRLRNMADGGTYTLNVASAMRPGSANTIVIDSKGPKGGSATVVISD